ncbi:membrane associated with 8 transmembrane domains [Cryptosporidium sp. chipmunk genotype I]|uniref:membrane associated with 8 transmembrane domains n=1 Tax=Cryptosporidium sp. chipmunk genotype I TaxID=1280935 RepID=UPI00351A447C|nr:membrane associated with 8 transmembrane domains [Cryptosporidium sp. chipmunk genotype I]
MKSLDNLKQTRKNEIELENILATQPVLFEGEEKMGNFTESDLEPSIQLNLKEDIHQVTLNIGSLTSVKGSVSSLEFIRQYTDKKEAIFLVAEYLLLISSITLGVYIIYQEYELADYLKSNDGFEKVVNFVNQANIMTIITTIVMVAQLIINCIFGILFILFKQGIIVKWVKIFKSKLFIDQVFIWQSPFISLPIIITAMVKLMVNCRSNLEEIKVLQESSLIIETSNFALNKLSFIIIYYSVYLSTNFIMELFVVRRQYLGNFIQSQRLGILDYSIAYIGNAALVASLILYCFRFRYSSSAESNIDLKSQVDYYYRTILAAAVHSGLIAILLGILGYIASLSCSKMLILISLIVKFYSTFVFSWSCSLVWFGNQLLKLFCNIDSVSPNLYSLPTQDYLAFKNACFTRPNFYMITVLVIIQLSLSAITLVLNFLFLISKKIWSSESN